MAIDKQGWVELFREIGLDEATMLRWHARFEARWPDDHQRFLEWLKVSSQDIARIREASRSEWTRV